MRLSVMNKREIQNTLVKQFVPLLHLGKLRWYRLIPCISWNPISTYDKYAGRPYFIYSVFLYIKKILH